MTKAVINTEEIGKIAIATNMKGLRIARPEINIDLRADIDPQSDQAVMLSLQISYPDGNGFVAIDFEECFPLTEVPAGLVDLRDVLRAEEGNIIGAMEACIESLIARRSTVDIFPGKDEEHGTIVFELRMDQVAFVTSARLPAGELREFLIVE